MFLAFKYKNIINNFLTEAAKTRKGATSFKITAQDRKAAREELPADLYDISDKDLDARIIAAKKSEAAPKARGGNRKAKPAEAKPKAEPKAKAAAAPKAAPTVNVVPPAGTGTKVAASPVDQFSKATARQAQTTRRDIRQHHTPDRARDAATQDKRVNNIRADGGFTPERRPPRPGTAAAKMGARAVRKGMAPDIAQSQAELADRVAKGNRGEAGRLDPAVAAAGVPQDTTGAPARAKAKAADKGKAKGTPKGKATDDAAALAGKVQGDLKNATKTTPAAPATPAEPVKPTVEPSAPEAKPAAPVTTAPDVSPVDKSAERDKVTQINEPGIQGKSGPKPAPTVPTQQQAATSKTAPTGTAPSTPPPAAPAAAKPKPAGTRQAGGTVADNLKNAATKTGSKTTNVSPGNEITPEEEEKINKAAARTNKILAKNIPIKKSTGKKAAGKKDVDKEPDAPKKSRRSSEPKEPRQVTKSTRTTKSSSKSRSKEGTIHIHKTVIRKGERAAGRILNRTQQILAAGTNIRPHPPRQIQYAPSL